MTAGFRTFFLFLILSLSSCQSVETSTLLAKEYYNLGNSYFEMKKYAEAARAYKAALEFQPTLKIAAMNLVRCLAEQGDAAGALILVKKMEDKDPGNLNLLKTEAYLLYLKGDKKESWALWKDLASRLPGDADTQFNAAIAAQDQKETDKARSYLEKYGLLDGKNAAAYLLAGDLHKAEKNWIEAESDYRKAQSLDKENPLVLQSLAEVLVTLELYGEAVDTYRQCVDLSEKNASANTERKNSDKKTVPSAPLIFLMAKIQLQAMEDYDAAWISFQAAWKKGFTDQSAWKKLLDVPDLFEKVRLQADLKSKGIYPADPKTLGSPTVEPKGTSPGSSPGGKP